MAEKLSARVKLNIRGTKFEIENEIVQKMPLSKLARLCLQLDSGEEMFFNRDPFVFNAILNYYVTGHLHVPTYVCPESIREEMAFWEMTYDDQMAPCCLNRLSKTEKEMSKTVEWKNTEDSPWPNGSSPQKWHRFFEFPNSSWPALIWAGVVFIHIVMSIVAVVMALSPEDSTGRREEQSATWNISHVLVLEFLSLGFLLFDFVIRLFLAKNKIGFLLQALNIIDILSLAACSVFFLLCVVEQFVDSPNLGKALLIVGALSMIRLFRLLRLVKICRKMELILRVVWASVIELSVLAILVVIFTVVFGVFVYLAEFREVGTQFSEPLAGMWYAVVTLTTVGYGDIIPLTPFGRVLGSLCAMAGLLIFVMPIPIFINNFGKYQSKMAATQRMENSPIQHEPTEIIPLETNGDINTEKI